MIQNGEHEQQRAVQSGFLMKTKVWPGFKKRIECDSVSNGSSRVLGQTITCLEEFIIVPDAGGGYDANRM